jgi:exosortase/archaeosortase family protein
MLQVLAFWPLWKWYALRLSEMSDDAWGLLALLTAALLLWRQPPATRLTTAQVVTSTLFVLLYAVTYPWLPALLRAGLAVLALACTVSAWRYGTVLHLSTWGLLGLSLPLISSWQFYLGYPLRVWSGTLATLMLQLSGFAVMREGTSLNWGGQQIWIDAPCSGVQMLWSGCYLTFTLAGVYGLSGWKTAGATLLACLAVLLGNALRAAALFYIEAGIITAPAWVHTGIGLVVFVGLALSISGSIYALQKWPVVASQAGKS